MAPSHDHVGEKNKSDFERATPHHGRSRFLELFSCPFLLPFLVFRCSLWFSLLSLTLFVSSYLLSLFFHSFLSCSTHFSVLSSHPPNTPVFFSPFSLLISLISLSSIPLSNLSSSFFLRFRYHYLFHLVSPFPFFLSSLPSFSLLLTLCFFPPLTQPTLIQYSLFLPPSPSFPFPSSPFPLTPSIIPPCCTFFPPSPSFSLPTSSSPLSYRLNLLFHHVYPSALPSFPFSLFHPLPLPSFFFFVPSPSSFLPPTTSFLHPPLPFSPTPSTIASFPIPPLLFHLSFLRPILTPSSSTLPSSPLSSLFPPLPYSSFPPSLTSSLPSSPFSSYPPLPPLLPSLFPSSPLSLLPLPPSTHPPIPPLPSPPPLPHFLTHLPSHPTSIPFPPPSPQPRFLLRPHRTSSAPLPGHISTIYTNNVD
ncbi:hypothetical protein C7M84_007129 [Penaeus vannamei]|uniref:Uncharacterized protein n=1 Tax=Penaeus vannamei TaxID=6689 RepID=A0A3R7N123_PENVA|nr:hypothetical protein C7M84_007129 [Penaeus vannamei]